MSHTALWQRLNNLKRLDLLSDAEKEKRYIRCCDVCGNSNILVGYTRFCSICGNELSQNTWGILPVYYSGPESSKNKVMICPKCGANLYHTTKPDCPSCGLHRHNGCTSGCILEVKPSDRYCIKCGSKSQYFTEGLLTHWWHAMETGEMVEKHKVKKRMFINDDISIGLREL